MDSQFDLSRRSLLKMIPGGVLGCVFLLSCRTSGPKSESDAKTNVVLFVCLTLGNPFYKEMIAGLEEAIAKDPNIILETRSGRTPTDVTGQTEIIHSFLARDSKQGPLKGVVLVPANSGVSVTSVIRELNDARVPVINLDIAVDNDALVKSGAHVDAFIGSDNVEGGRAAADLMAKYLPSGGNMLILLGGLGEATTRDRRKGYVDRLDELRAQRGYKSSILERSGNWAETTALTETDSLLSSGFTLDGIFAENDLMALGASKAVSAHTLKKKPVIIGYDATPDARAAIKAGTLTASISQNPAEMGRKAIAALKTLWSGSSIEKPREFTLVSPITADVL